MSSEAEAHMDTEELLESSKDEAPVYHDGDTRGRKTSSDYDNSKESMM